MLSHKAEQFSYHSGCGRGVPGSADGEPSRGVIAARDGGTGIETRLRCTGCSTDLPENDILEITDYRVGETGADEVTFVCPLCGCSSTSVRTGRAGGCDADD